MSDCLYYIRSAHEVACKYDLHGVRLYGNIIGLLFSCKWLYIAPFRSCPRILEEPGERTTHHLTFSVCLSVSVCRGEPVEARVCTSPSPLTLLHPFLRLYGQRLATVTMTTGGCCHLPGSLCDCASGTGLWKSVEEAAGGDGCQALYVTQVTAIDGRLLSSVLKPISTQR